jgi:hypothetical protein
VGVRFRPRKIVFLPVGSVAREIGIVNMRGAQANQIATAGCEHTVDVVER